ncbi:OmpA/MotB family protein [Desulfobacula phenolica]|uniref:Chemotaxis protein MotB n=1 Tax=Desulfobacula phenolica TaxID=90732 RepID=A0A1H2DP47_9BACT|nr:OmpA family protein [Desulfobacula phenolica]SDT84586.1 chemotaxis protein MotB [Desulfobacula phenolica]
MGYRLINHKLMTGVLIFLLIIYLGLPSLVWSAGFQEQKLFDGDFYSIKELIKKIETHNKELKVIDHQIKVVEKDIDWLVLKINQIRDSGRTVSSKLKDAITIKEKKKDVLHKNKNRIESLVRYYSAAVSKNNKQSLVENILKKNGSENPLPEKSAILKPPALIEHKSVADLNNNDNQISKSDLQAAINKSDLGDWVEIVGTGTCLQMKTILPILFSSGSADVAGEYKSFFKKLATFLKPYDVKILVNGYADTVPIKNKTYPSNFELGAKRAANIVHLLINSGLKPSIFKIASPGKYRFSAKGMSKQKTFERRAEVTVVFSG